jgi:ligand-binding sensor domain-containing protein
MGFRMTSSYRIFLHFVPFVQRFTFALPIIVAITLFVTMAGAIWVAASEDNAHQNEFTKMIAAALDRQRANLSDVSRELADRLASFEPGSLNNKDAGQLARILTPTRSGLTQSAVFFLLDDEGAILAKNADTVDKLDVQ